MSIVEIKNLKVGFNLHGTHVEALRDISFSIPKAKTLALVGESGSGKSVTAQAIMRILPKSASITHGNILLTTTATQAIDIVKLNPNSTQMRDIRGGTISMIFQEPMVSLSPVHTIGSQVSESVLLHQGVTKSQADEISKQMLDLVGFEDANRTMKSYSFELSGGLRQRAMIACALVCRPSLLIADEPTTALDVTIQAQILKLIRDIQDEFQMAVLLITHDLGVVANMADEVVVMYHGEIMETGTREDIFNEPGHPYLKSLIAAVPHFNMRKGERLKPIREISLDSSNLIKPKPVENDSRQNSVHLNVSHLYKHYTIHKTRLFDKNEEEFIPAVDGISFDVKRGECFGLVGESGCGKSTLSKILMKAILPNAGNIEFFDSDMEINVLDIQADQLLSFRRKMQIIFQDPFSSLNPRMTVYDIIREPLEIHQIGDEHYRKQRCRELMHMVGLNAKYLNRYPHSFSGGQRQRIGIARALALEPEFLICDEPVSALDVSIQAQILNLLKDLKQEFNLTYIFISHNLAVVDYIADRIAVMCKGRIVELAPKEKIYSNPIHPYTKALFKAVPYPDLNKPLNFSDILDKSASDPKLWPPPYGEAEEEEFVTQLTAVSFDHFVQKRVF